MPAGAALRERAARYLAQRSFGVLSAADGEGAWALPVRYRVSDTSELGVCFLVPRWTDAAYHAVRSGRGLLVVPDGSAQRWLACRGRVTPEEAPRWNERWAVGTRCRLPPEELYVAMRLTTERVELVDEERGWGVRETLDLGLELGEVSSA